MEQLRLIGIYVPIQAVQCWDTHYRQTAIEWADYVQGCSKARQPTLIPTPEFLLPYKRGVYATDRDNT